MNAFERAAAASRRCRFDAFPPEHLVNWVRESRLWWLMDHSNVAWLREREALECAARRGDEEAKWLLQHISYDSPRCEGGFETGALFGGKKKLNVLL